MKIHWATGDIPRIANQFGFAVHNEESKQALAATGVELCEDAETSVYVTTPFLFDPPDDGKRHVVFTAWDSLSLPPAAKASLAKADAVICASSYMEDVFRPHLRPGVPLYVCNLGVDCDRFARKKPRKLRKNERMKVLWVGAPNQRKGYPFVLSAFQSMSEWPIDFYLKTTSPDEGNRQFNIMGGKNGGARVIFDSRRLSDEDMVKLYHDAHVFLFPTMGEGFGLTLAEAMASALPCIYTPWSGVTDYCDSGVAIPLKYHVETLDMSPNLPKSDPNYDSYSFIGEAAHSDIRSICESLQWVLENYKRADVKGRQAAIRMRSKFTWEHTGKRLRSILEEVEATAWPPA